MGILWGKARKWILGVPLQARKGIGGSWMEFGFGFDLLIWGIWMGK